MLAPGQVITLGCYNPYILSLVVLLRVVMSVPMLTPVARVIPRRCRTLATYGGPLRVSIPTTPRPSSYTKPIPSRRSLICCCPPPPTSSGYSAQKNLATIACNKVSGWKMGFEPTTLGTTILYSNRLSYIHHLICFRNRVQIYTLFSILQNFWQLILKNMRIFSGFIVNSLYFLFIE